MRTFVSILVLCAIAPELEARQAARDLKELFAPDHVLRTHCDLKPERIGVLRATLWKGYENTGFETSQVPISDWSSWRSLQFDVENHYPEPISIYVRVSDRVDHPCWPYIYRRHI